MDCNLGRTVQSNVQIKAGTHWHWITARQVTLLKL